MMNEFIKNFIKNKDILNEFMRKNMWVYRCNI